MPNDTYRALAAHVRVVAVPIPRSDSSIGRVLAHLDANPGRAFSIEDIAGRLRMDVAIVRQSVADLKIRGLLIGSASDKRAGRQPVWLYQLAMDLSAHLPADKLAAVLP